MLIGRFALAFAVLGLGCATPGIAETTDAAEPEVSEPPAFILVEHRLAALLPGGSAGDPAFRPLARREAEGQSTSLRDRVLAAVRAAELRHNLPAGLLDALIATESAYLPWAVSRAGAAGLAQLMPATAAELGIVNRFDPIQSIEGGARYLRRMLDRFGSVSLALAAYNAGPGSVVRAGGIPANGETPSYVARVLRRWLMAGPG